jgi:ABC-type nitrate/sulfonate/bicarbonate transport system permease component
MKTKPSSFETRSQLSASTGIVLGAIPIVLVIAAWFLLTWGATPEDRIISNQILPSPSEIASKALALVETGGLVAGIAASFRRVLVGFLIAAGIALPLGIAMGSFAPIKASFSPVAVIGGYLPIAALVPLTLSWFGTEELQKYMFLAIAFFVYLLPLVVKAVDKVDEVFIQTAYTLGASRMQVVFRVLVPVAAYDIWQALRLAFGIGWSYIILAETIMADAGLGQIIIIAQRRGPREYMYLVIIVIAIMAALTDKIMAELGRKLFVWKKAEG